MTIIINGKRYDDNETWPNTTRVLNVSAFYPADSRFRGGEGLERQRVDPAMHGRPQLTWFSGNYQVPADDERGNRTLCRWPKIVTHMEKGRRKCLEPGQLTPAELEEWNKQWQLDSEAVQRSAEARPECYEGVVEGRKRMVYTTYEAGKSYPSLYDCETGVKIRDLPQNVVRGLGATEAEDQAVSDLKRSYRTTEMMLVGALALAFLLVVKK